MSRPHVHPARGGAARVGVTSGGPSIASGHGRRGGVWSLGTVGISTKFVHEALPEAHPSSDRSVVITGMQIVNIMLFVGLS